MFGPPRCVTIASTCSWLGHRVSGLRYATNFALFRLAFASAPWLDHLTLLHIVTRRPILQKVQDQTITSWWVVLSLLVSIQFQVLFHSPPGVLFTVPSRYYSLSVNRSYLALRDGPRIFTPDTRVLCYSGAFQGNFNFGYGTITLFCATFQSSSPIVISFLWKVLNPKDISTFGLGSCSFARHYYRNRLFTFFSSAYLDVSVQRVPLITLWIRVMIIPD